MVKRLYSALTSSIVNAGTALGLAAGVVIGVISASGFNFSAGDAARFVGALLGALIPVAGAVILHYLKERELRDERRKMLLDMCVTARAFGLKAVSQIDEDEAKSEILAGAKVFEKQFQRCRRFAEKFEFEDSSINEALSWLDTRGGESPNDVEELASFGEGYSYLRAALVFRTNAVADCVNVMEGRKEEMLASSEDWIE